MQDLDTFLDILYTLLKEIKKCISAFLIFKDHTLFFPLILNIAPTNFYMIRISVE